MARAAKAEEQIEDEEEVDNPVITKEEAELIRSQGAPDDYANAPVETKPEEGDAKPAPDAAKPDEKTDEEKKAEEDAAAKKAEEDAKDPFLKIETELVKPEGQEDLKDFTEREKAYFFQMRRDRKSRQQAEADRDAAVFRESKLKKQAESAPAAKPKAEEDPLAGKDDTDFLTVGEVKKLLEGKKPAAAADDDAVGSGIDPVISRYLEMSDNAARIAHPEDYDSVMELTAEIINSNPQYVKTVGEALKKGDNPAEVSYNLIKSDPEFAKLFPAAQVRWAARQKAAKKPDSQKTSEQLAAEAQKAEEAKKAQEKLEKNQQKTKTTGSVNTGLTDRSGEELSAQQVADMSDTEFSKLPKPTREKYLRLYG